MVNLLKKYRKYLFFTKRGGPYLPLILLVFFISSCGITIYYYLNPPIHFTNLSFYHAYNNDPNYAIGYDFFYRIYDGVLTTESNVINEANTFFTDNNLLELLFSNTNLISNSYFKRVLPVSDDLLTDYDLSNNPIPTVIAPLQKIDPVYFDKDDPSKIFTVTFNISTGKGSIVSSGYTPVGSYIKDLYFERYITTNGIDFERKSFLEINESQDDVPPLDGSITINIAFYVVLYGRNENYVPIFSDVVYIGSYNNLTYN